MTVNLKSYNEVVGNAVIRGTKAKLINEMNKVIRDLGLGGRSVPSQDLKGYVKNLTDVRISDGMGAVNRLFVIYNDFLKAAKKYKRTKDLGDQAPRDFPVNQIQQRQYKNFYTTEVDVNFKDTTNVNTIKDNITNFAQSRFKKLSGSIINVKLKFKQSNHVYTTGEFRFNNVESLRDRLEGTIIENWVTDRQNYEDKELWDVTGFSLVVTDPVGGCSENGGADLIINGLKPADLDPKLVNVNVQNNNCLLSCVVRHFDMEKARKTKKGFNKSLEYMNNTCKGLKAQLFPNKKADDFLDFNDIPKVEAHFKCQINVWTVGAAKLEKIRGVPAREDVPSVNLILDKSHYYLVKNESLLEYQKSPYCKLWYKDLPKHMEICTRCQKCGHWVHNGKHTEEECKYSLNEMECKQGYIKKKALHKTFKGDKGFIDADFETFTGEDGKLVVYAVGYQIDDAPAVILYGPDCLNQFVDILLAQKSKYTLVFYNGSRFDIWFIVEKLAARNIHIKQEIFSNNAYKKISFANITIWDLNLHLDGSLKSNCEAFGLNKDESKTDFDHKLIKSWADVETYKNDQGKIKGWHPYLERDVVALRALRQKYLKATWDSKHVNAHRFLTASAMSYFVWRTMLGDDVSIKLLSYDEDLFARRSIYGGRCFPQKQWFEADPGDDTDYLVDIDVVSLYPTAMCNPYPVGDHEYLGPEKFEEVRALINEFRFAQLPFKHAIIECDIETEKSLVTPALPRTNEKGFLTWDLKNIEKGVYTSVDIRRAITLGYRVTKIHKLMYWTKEAEIFESYIKREFENKKKSAKNTPQYALSKLCMNALFGKMLQRPILEQHKLVTSYGELEKIRADNLVSDVKYISDDKAVAYFIPKEPDQKVNKPSYIGAFILSYSRRIMDKFITTIGGWCDLERTFFRTDTDSLIIHARYLPLLKNYIGTNLGDLDFDIKGKIIRFAEVCPKVYCCEYVSTDAKDAGKVKLHVKAKGFNKETQSKLTFDDFRRMIWGSNIDEKQDVKDDYGNNRGFILRRGNQITGHCADKLKKQYFPNKKFSFSSIYSITQERTLQKTKWEKRIRVPGHANLGTLPIGYEGLDPIVA